MCRAFFETKSNEDMKVVFMLAVLVIGFVAGCRDDDRVYLLDEFCQCAPIEAPVIDYVRRSGDELHIKECCYANIGFNVVELEQGVINYELVDIGFWQVRRFPFEFHRERRGDEMHEYILYYGQRIDLMP